MNHESIDIFKHGIKEIKLNLRMHSKKQREEQAYFEYEQAQLSIGKSKEVKVINKMLNRQFFSSNYNKVKKYLSVRQTVV